MDSMRSMLQCCLFMIMGACQSPEKIPSDFAAGPGRDAWLHHPVLGDPSPDNFIRYEKNPVLRGTPPLEWPVNGFYFLDPISGDEYIFAGRYPKNYAISSKETALEITDGCVAFCSVDHGKTWQNKGSIFQDRNVILTGEKAPVSFAPDVSVVCEEGKYYIGFDYVTREFSWAGDNLRHSGLAVAVADHPGGPYRIMKDPAVPCSRFYQKPLFGKYNRCYAGTLLKTKQGWVMLFMLDSGNHFSWALAAVSAPTPEGPWSKPVVINSTESNDYYPSLLEYFPAFQHNDTIYAPATSVALNRNFQSIFRAAASEVMEPERWELWREGSLWHPENQENERAGIWGQTFSGFVTGDGKFKVMYPGLDSLKRGTINLAATSWNKMAADSGFVLAGCQGASYTELSGFYSRPSINASFNYYGTVALLLHSNAPIGPDVPKADATLHPLMTTSQTRILLSGEQWCLLDINSAGRQDTTASGSFIHKQPTTLNVMFHGPETILFLNGNKVWQGEVKNREPGRIGLFAAAHSGISMKKFQVSGDRLPGYTNWLYTEGLLNAGNGLNDWDIVKDNSHFTYGTGAVSKSDSTRIKWSFKGSGFDLYAPPAPGSVTVRIILNGELIAALPLPQGAGQKNNIIYSMRNLPQSKNALVIQVVGGKFAIDCLKVYD